MGRLRSRHAVTQRCASRHGVRPRWAMPWSALAIVLIMLTGLTLLLYPTAASWIYQYNQANILEDARNRVERADPPGAEQIALAHRYNDALRFGAQVEADHRLPTGFGVSSDSSLNYHDILNVTDEGIMGRIRVPVADVDLPIYHGTTDEVLLKGSGHLEGTSLPVGGIGTHTVITGHRGLADAAMFTHLDRVKEGDTFTFEIFNEVLTYQVIDIRVVEPQDTESLRADPENDLATLITCTPLGINSHRILVTGERIIPTPVSDIENAGKRSGLPRFPWWLVILATAVVISVAFVWKSGYPPRPRSFRRGRDTARSRPSRPRHRRDRRDR